ncbi:MAG: LLM class flavin-dependent oxidoreductase, partial [Candidatus Lutacidiplasmatales archaeon]
MHLSAFTVVDSYPEDVAAGRDRFAEVLALAETGDRAGLTAIWVAEHHFHAGGVCPSPPVLLSAIATRTRRIRVGALVSVLPFHNPVELAEQYAMVDRLAGGRLNLGVGSGYIPLEFEGFGVDPATKRERFDSALETLVAGLRGEAIVPTGTGRRPLNVT